MATTRIMPLHIGKGRTESRAISDIIDYVANPQKTDNGKLITGYGTMCASHSNPVKSRRKKPTAWAWNLPSGSPRAITPLWSALT